MSAPNCPRCSREMIFNQQSLDGGKFDCDCGQIMTNYFPKQNKPMNNTPQSVTQRYISNLIHNGRNKEFDIEHIIQKEHVVDSTIVGYYYEVRVLSKSSNERAVGTTIQQAIRNALIAHGVTFR